MYLYVSCINEKFISALALHRLTYHLSHVVTKYIYTQSTTVSVPSSELGPPHPSPPGSVSPPQPKGGTHSPAWRGWGSPNSDDWRKSLALCLICVSGAWNTICLSCN